MKTIIDAIIVVEGKSDVTFLSSFLEADFVTTNGSDIPPLTIEHLRELSHKRDIIVLTDPDAPGERIRAILDEKIPGLKHSFIPKKMAIKHHKVGIAEADKNTILSSLSHHVVSTPSSKRGTISFSDLYRLGLAGRESCDGLRESLADRFHLGHVNAKLFLKRLNAMDIDLGRLEEAMHEIRG